MLFDATSIMACLLGLHKSQTLQVPSSTAPMLSSSLAVKITNIFLPYSMFRPINYSKANFFLTAFHYMYKCLTFQSLFSQ